MRIILKWRIDEVDCMDLIEKRYQWLILSDTAADHRGIVLTN
jgi:hypothetical protein